MPYKFGTDSVSPTQQMQLDMAKSPSCTPDRLAVILHRVLRDDEISSGEEALHPDWNQLFYSNQKNLPDELKAIFPKPFSEALSEVDPRKLRLCFLLGAGASKPEPSAIPTVKELLPDLLQRARRLDRDDVTRLADFCEGARITNIEDLLTAAQLSEFCARNSAVLALVDFLLFREQQLDPRTSRRRRLPADVSSIALLQDTLQVLFGLLSSRMLPADPNNAHTAIADYVKTHSNTSIVTTNYDCCMDRALSSSGLKFDYVVEFANSKQGAGEIIPLLKLHGSLNWFYCDTCQHVYLLDIERTVKDYLGDQALYPVIGVCKECGGQRRGLLVPPLAMKFDVAPPLNPLLELAGGSFEKADLIVVVGFSFADADFYLTRMLTKAMQKTAARLLIVDPDFSVVSKVRRRFGVRIPFFQDDRILSWVGDCSEILPKFLSGAHLPLTSVAAEKETARNGSPGEVPNS